MHILRNLIIHYPCSTIYGSKASMNTFHTLYDIKIKHVKFYQIKKSDFIRQPYNTFLIDCFCNNRVSHWGTKQNGFNKNVTTRKNPLEDRGTLISRSGVLVHLGSCSIPSTSIHYIRRE